MNIYTKCGFKEYLALILVGGSFLLLIFEVIFRYIIGSSLEWTDEISRLLLVWMTFFGMGFVIGEKKEIVCKALGQKLPKKMYRYWSFGIDVLISIFTIFLLFYGSHMTIFSWEVRTDAMEFPFSFFYVSIPVGCLTMLYFLGKRIKKILIERTENEKK